VSEIVFRHVPGKDTINVEILSADGHVVVDLESLMKLIDDLSTSEEESIR